jgi:hypothetical protein
MLEVLYAYPERNDKLSEDEKAFIRSVFYPAK